MEEHITDSSIVIKEPTGQNGQLYLNATLKSLHALSLLISDNSDPDKFLSKLPSVIVRQDGIKMAWTLIAELDGRVISGSFAGLPGYPDIYESFIKKQQLPNCLIPHFNETGWQVIDTFPAFNSEHPERNLAGYSYSLKISKQLKVILVTAFDQVFATDIQNRQVSDVLAQIVSTALSHHQTIHRLQESEEKFHVLFEKSSDAQLIMKGDVYIDCNLAMVQILGAESKDDIIGLTPWEVSPEYQADGLKSTVKGLGLIQAAEDGESIRAEWVHNRFDGTEVDVEVSLTPVDFGSGSFTHVAMRDISDRKRAEKELFAAKELAEESDRLKSAFLANMSHEIRTPMNSILGFAELLGEEDLSTEERKQYINIIQSGTNQLLSIISDIIDVSKIQAGQVVLHPELVNLDELFEVIQINFQYELEKRHKSNVEVKRSCMCHALKERVVVDPGRLNQVMGNLISNAIKFTDHGSIEFGCTLDRGFVRFFVKDTGKGISMNHQKIIFDRFRQVEETLTRTYSGTGLGLAICKGLIILMGGEIGVNSEPGKGSEFWFTLPVSQKE